MHSIIVEFGNVPASLHLLAGAGSYSNTGTWRQRLGKVNIYKLI